jgi:hypothetical protein
LSDFGISNPVYISIALAIDIIFQNGHPAPSPRFYAYFSYPALKSWAIQMRAFLIFPLSCCPASPEAGLLLPPPNL